MVGTQRQFVERLGGYTVLTTSINTISTGELFVKRLFDIIGGLVGCVLTGILFLFLAPAIKIQVTRTGILFPDPCGKKRKEV